MQERATHERSMQERATHERSTQGMSTQGRSMNYKCIKCGACLTPKAYVYASLSDAQETKRMSADRIKSYPYVYRYFWECPKCYKKNLSEIEDIFFFINSYAEKKKILRKVGPNFEA